MLYHILDDEGERVDSNLEAIYMKPRKGSEIKFHPEVEISWYTHLGSKEKKSFKIAINRVN